MIWYVIDLFHYNNMKNTNLFTMCFSGFRHRFQVIIFGILFILGGSSRVRSFAGSVSQRCPICPHGSLLSRLRPCLPAWSRWCPRNTGTNYIYQVLTGVTNSELLHFLCMIRLCFIKIKWRSSLFRLKVHLFYLITLVVGYFVATIVMRKLLNGASDCRTR